MSGAVIVPAMIAGQSLRLTFKFGTMALAERELGQPVTDALARGSMGLDMLGCLFWAALQPAHRMTRAASDDLVDEAGIEAVAGWVGKGLAQYFGGDVSPDDGPAPERERGERKPGKRPAS